MLFPSKHLKLSESIWAVGGIILGLLETPKDTENIWRNFTRINNTPELPHKHSFDNFLMGLNFLFSISLIEINEEGVISKQ